MGNLGHLSCTRELQWCSKMCACEYPSCMWVLCTWTTLLKVPWARSECLQHKYTQKALDSYCKAFPLLPAQTLQRKAFLHRQWVTHLVFVWCTLTSWEAGRTLTLHPFVAQIDFPNGINSTTRRRTSGVCMIASTLGPSIWSRFFMGWFF